MNRFEGQSDNKEGYYSGEALLECLRELSELKKNSLDYALNLVGLSYADLRNLKDELDALPTDVRKELATLIEDYSKTTEAEEIGITAKKLAQAISQAQT